MTLAIALAIGIPIFLIMTFLTGWSFFMLHTKKYKLTIGDIEKLKNLNPYVLFESVGGDFKDDNIFYASVVNYLKNGETKKYMEIFKKPKPYQKEKKLLTRVTNLSILNKNKTVEAEITKIYSSRESIIKNLLDNIIREGYFHYSPYLVLKARHGFLPLRVVFASYIRNVFAGEQK